MIFGRRRSDLQGGRHGFGEIAISDLHLDMKAVRRPLQQDVATVPFVRGDLAQAIGRKRRQGRGPLAVEQRLMESTAPGIGN